jgi:hypothetical protein
MMNSLTPILSGAVAALGLVAALFFLRFWRRTGDRFFMLFAAAFVIDAAARFFLGWGRIVSEAEPYYYLPRLLMFALIILAVVEKNRSS